LSASVVWVGERFDRDYSVMPYETVALPGYVLVDVVLAAPLGRGLELFVRADNILDARYEAVFGYGAPGRAFRTGIRLTL
jgi:vitamin B12 transporter